MTRPTKTTYCLTIWLLLAALPLLLGGCAAPQSTAGLQQRIDQLLEAQQKQARQLTQLQQQLADLQIRPPVSPQDAAIAEEQPAAAEPAQGAVVLPPTLTPPTLTPPAAQPAEISAAAQLYLEAFAAIATGQMAEAESGFKVFLSRFPAHEYAGNANYWLAESLLAQQKNRLAETVLLGIIDNPQQQNKAPAAMARLVNYYRESGAQNNAAAMLEMLSSRYPESPELKRLMRSSEPRG